MTFSHIDDLLALTPTHLADAARAKFLGRHHDEAAKLCAWIDAYYANDAAVIDADALEVICRSRMNVHDVDGLASLLRRSSDTRLSVWFWNDAARFLQRLGRYSDAIELMMEQKRASNWDPLLDLRLEELQRCNSSPEFVPYFRRSEFDTCTENDRLLLDEAVFSVYCDVPKSMPINGGLGTFNWPKSLRRISTRDLILEDVTVLSDCSVLCGKLLLYETVKAVQPSWRFTHPRCNDFFGQYSTDDSWVQFHTAPRISGALDHAFLVPNPIEGVGHFIHDALPTIESFRKYRTLVADPKIVLRRLRPFDGRAIRDLIGLYFGDVQVTEMQPGEGIEVKRLYASTAPFSPSQRAVSPEAVRSIRQVTPHIFAGSQRDGSKIYVTREDGQNIDGRSKIDRLVVQSGMLERLNFIKVTLSNMSFREQCKVINGAAHVAGVHGAGLMNIAFGDENMAVTELIVPSAANYYTIAMFSAAMDFKYLAVDTAACLTPDGTALSSAGLEIIAASLGR